MKYIYAVLILILFTYCTNENQVGKKNSHKEPLLDAGVEEILANYINAHMDYNSYTLIPMKNNDVRMGYEVPHYLYVLGPSMQKMFNNGEGSFAHYPSTYVRIKGRMVFLQSSLDCLYNDNTISPLYKKYSMTSVQEVNKAWEFFLSHGIAFVVDSNTHALDVFTERPDTLFKQITEFSAPPLFE